MIVALDAMGGDLAPAETVAGALLAKREFGIDVALVGNPAAIRQELAKHGETPPGIEIVEATEVVEMDDAPAQAVRQKKQASINVAMGMIKDGSADALLSAGNTGAVMAAALLKLGRVRGVERPAIGAMAPFTDTGILILDIGANVDCKPSWLVQFGQMGSVYMEKVFGIARPRVGLLNIGEEETKGNELSQDVYARLQETSLNFVGNVEPDRVPQGVVDVLITDGFTGNVAVKVTEGVADFIFSQLRETLASRLHYKLAAAVLKPALMQMRSKMDYGEYGGAPLLGVNGAVIVAHGRADAQAIKSGLLRAREVASSGMLDALRGALEPSARDGAKEVAAATRSRDETRA